MYIYPRIYGHYSVVVTRSHESICRTQIIPKAAQVNIKGAMGHLNKRFTLVRSAFVLPEIVIDVDVDMDLFLFGANQCHFKS